MPRDGTGTERTRKVGTAADRAGERPLAPGTRRQEPTGAKVPATAAGQLLALQRSAGNRAVASALSPVQREPTVAPPATLIRPRSWGPDILSHVTAKRPKGAVRFDRFLLLCLGGMAVYGPDGELLRLSTKELPRDFLTQNDGQYHAVGNGDGGFLYTNPFGAGTWASPFAAGFGASLETLLQVTAAANVFIAITPAWRFAPDEQKAGGAGEPDPKERRAVEATAAMVQEGLAAAAMANQDERSALFGTPTITVRHSARSGWHVRVRLDREQTEVKVSPGEPADSVRKKVDAAVEKLRARTDVKDPGPATPPPSKVDPKGPKPPPWYVPFEAHASQKDGEATVNAPPLPATVVLAANPGDRAPSMVAGAQADFTMQVDWEPGPAGISHAMTYQYYWEVLAASRADWFESARLPDPEAKGRRPPVAADEKAENRSTGSGTRTTRADDQLGKTGDVVEDVGEDISADVDDDFGAVGGEAVAGGWKIATTFVTSMAMDVMDRRGPNRRRIAIPGRGLYLVRCTAMHPSKGEFVRAASVAVVPVKVSAPATRAAEGAASGLRGAKGRGAYQVYEQELRDMKRKLRLSWTLGSDDAVNRTRDDETLAVWLEAIQGGGLVAYRTTLFSRIKQLGGDDGEHQDEVRGWHERLKPLTDDGVRDVSLGATFVNDQTGDVVPLRLMLGQVRASTEEHPHWTVFDITSPSTRDVYEGVAAPGPFGVSIPAGPGPGGALGHVASIKRALQAFAGGNPYGRGTIALAWPGEVAGVGTATLPRAMRSAPDKEHRQKSRHKAYVQIATLLVPVAKLGMLAEVAQVAEAIAAVGGGLDAIDELRKRSRTGHLGEVGTVLEVLAVVGAARFGASSGLAVLSGAPALRVVAGRAGQALEVLAKLETGVQLLLVPQQVLSRLDEIQAQPPPGASGRKVLLGMITIAKGVKDGIITARGLTHQEQELFEKGAPEDNQSADPTTQRPPPDGTVASHPTPTTEPTHGGDGGADAPRKPATPDPSRPVPDHAGDPPRPVPDHSGDPSRPLPENGRVPVPPTVTAPPASADPPPPLFDWAHAHALPGLTDAPRVSSGGDEGSLVAGGGGVFRTHLPDGTPVVVKLLPDTPRRRSQLLSEAAGAWAAEQAGGGRAYGLVVTTVDGHKRVGLAMQEAPGGFLDVIPSRTLPSDVHAREEVAAAARRAAVGAGTVDQLRAFSDALLARGWHYSGEVQMFVDDAGGFHPIDFQGITRLPTEPAARDAALADHRANLEPTEARLRGLATGNAVTRLATRQGGSPPADAQAVRTTATTGPAAADHDAVDAVRSRGDFAVLRAHVEGLKGLTEPQQLALRARMQEARMAVTNEQLRTVLGELEARHPSLRFVVQDLGTVGFGSDRDVTIRVLPRDEASYAAMGSDAKAAVDRTLVTASAEAVPALYQAHARAGFPADRSLDTNFYTELHEGSFTKESGAIAADQQITALAEVLVHGGAGPFRQYVDHQREHLEGLRRGGRTPAKDVDALLDRLDRQVVEAERHVRSLLGELPEHHGRGAAHEAALDAARRRLVEALGRTPPPADRELRRLMADVKLLEPGAYGTRAAVEGVVHGMQGMGAATPEAVRQAGHRTAAEIGRGEGEPGPHAWDPAVGRMVEVSAEQELSRRRGAAQAHVGARRPSGSGSAYTDAAPKLQAAEAVLGHLLGHEGPLAASAAAKDLGRIVSISEDAGVRDADAAMAHLPAVVDAKKAGDVTAATEAALRGWAETPSVKAWAGRGAAPLGSVEQLRAAFLAWATDRGTALVTKVRTRTEVAALYEGAPVGSGS